MAEVRQQLIPMVRALVQEVMDSVKSTVAGTQFGQDFIAFTLKGIMKTNAKVFVVNANDVTEMQTVGEKFVDQKTDDEEVDKTDWHSVRLISAILFFSAIQMFCIGMSEWPYMQQIDPKATSTFFGYVGSASALGHAICAPLAGWWGSATGRSKPPMIAGRIIALIGCFIYICLEFFPANRRYIMLLCYTIFGISMSTVSVMRSYVAKVSSIEDRPRAVSLFGLATVVAVTAGPLFQLLFSPLKYPGMNVLFGKIRLNIYTGPIWIATAANILSLILIVFVFHDKKAMKREIGSKELLAKVNPQAIVRALSTSCKQLDVSLAFLCIVNRMVLTLGMVTLHTTTSPLLMSVIGLSNTETVTYGSATQAFVGCMNLGLLLAFSTKRIGKILNERIGGLLSLLFFLVMYVATYPWPFIGSHIVIKNVTDPNSTGCDENMYKWCDGSPSVNLFVYLGSLILTLGIAITLSMISVDSLYSKILGNIDQGPMQGVFLFCIDIINICGPLIIAPTFTASGQKYIWMVNGIAVICMIVLWCFFYRRLKPYINRPSRR
ncbi:Major facilitator superfamily domain-containing protein 8 [Toxocara canis]|uniref:Major facilitator superfamily domain-containing protein 8 n=1 Tax=Toxocara canis TaxID=6265 RepID=A0A0B2UTQ2_TOXCA|nr:Major facilitator superfamily domain-containing protein 8 [Toxocara canis]